jgi:hypothetical protein
LLRNIRRRAKTMFFGRAIAGFLAGGFIGFLTRPSIPFVGQLPFETVILRGANLNGINALILPVAQESFNSMLTFAIFGTVVALIAGYFYDQKGPSVENDYDSGETGKPIETDIKNTNEEKTSQKGQDIHYALVITEKESLEGTEKTILLHRKNNEVDKIIIKIPTGIKSGQELRISGKGHSGLNGGTNGDLYVKIHYDTKIKNSQENATKSNHSAYNTSIIEINEKQRIILSIIAMAIFATFLYLPFGVIGECGYHFFYEFKNYYHGCGIHSMALIVEWIGIVILGGIFLLLAKDK